MIVEKINHIPDDYFQFLINIFFIKRLSEKFARIGDEKTLNKLVIFNIFLIIYFFKIKRI